jgi:hypothetical protein
MKNLIKKTDHDYLLHVRNDENILEKLNQLVYFLNKTQIDIGYYLWLNHNYQRNNKKTLQWESSIKKIEENEYGDYFSINVNAKVDSIDIMEICLEYDGYSCWMHLESGNSYELASFVFGIDTKELCQYFTSFEELKNCIERRVFFFRLHNQQPVIKYMLEKIMKDTNVYNFKKQKTN